MIIWLLSSLLPCIFGFQVLNPVDADMFATPYKFLISDSPLPLTMEGELIDIKQNNNTYHCRLPLDSQDTQEIPKTPQELDTLLKAGLKALASNACVYLLTGYWTYELCPFKHVRQYHQSNVKQPLWKYNDPLEYFLGLYSPRVSSKLVVSDKVSIEQEWDSGTVCAVNGAPRSVSIQYFCAPVESLSAVREVSTCRYSVSYFNPRLCFGDFVQKVKNEPHILCSSSNLLNGTELIGQEWVSVMHKLATSKVKKPLNKAK